MSEFAAQESSSSEEDYDVCAELTRQLIMGRGRAKKINQPISAAPGLRSSTRNPLRSRSSAAAAGASSSSAAPKVEIDESQPTITAQITMADGSTRVWNFLELSVDVRKLEKKTINLYVTRNRKLRLQTKKYMKSNNIKLKSRQDFR